MSIEVFVFNSTPLEQINFHIFFLLWKHHDGICSVTTEFIVQPSLQSRVWLRFLQIHISKLQITVLKIYKLISSINPELLTLFFKYLE